MAHFFWIFLEQNVIQSCDKFLFSVCYVFASTKMAWSYLKLDQMSKAVKAGHLIFGCEVGYDYMVMCSS
jgi:hypothetical protein